MQRYGWLLLLLPALWACEDDGLFRGEDPPPPPDSGIREIRDAGFTDVGFVDASIPSDAGFPADAEPPPAEEPVYIHTGEDLYSYDPVNNQALRIGRFTTSGGPLELDIVDIAIDLNGRMYGGANAQGNDRNEIYQIDPSTGACTFRFTFDDDLNGMTFLPDGSLVVAGARISVLNSATGQLIREYTQANQYETSGDIVGLPDGNLYWTVRGQRDPNGGFVSDRVVRIAPSTGNLTMLGDAQIDRIYGLGYADGELFGFSSTGRVVTLNPTSGVVLRQNDLPGRWFGATTNPVRW